jgi:hypothetical protein
VLPLLPLRLVEDVVFIVPDVLFMVPALAPLLVVVVVPYEDEVSFMPVVPALTVLVPVLEPASLCIVPCMVVEPVASVVAWVASAGTVSLGLLSLVLLVLAIDALLVSLLVTA